MAHDLAAVGHVHVGEKAAQVGGVVLGVVGQGGGKAAVAHLLPGPLEQGGQRRGQHLLHLLRGRAGHAADAFQGLIAHEGIHQSLLIHFDSLLTEIF